MLRDFFAHWNAGNPKLIAASVVALYEHPNGIASFFCIAHARRSPDPALEFVAHHTRAAADVAFFNRAGVSAIKRVPCIFGMNMKAVAIVEPAVPSFSDYRQRPTIAFHIRLA